jgi:hypothetical protein
MMRQLGFVPPSLYSPIACFGIGFWSVTELAP